MSKLQQFNDEQSRVLAHAVEIAEDVTSNYYKISFNEWKRDYYKICLQDHMILDALARESELKLLPLAAYIVTHELIHVVRFSKFLQNFQASPAEQTKEEALVHTTTLEMFRKVKLPDLNYVLNSYHASCQMEKFSER